MRKILASKEMSLAALKSFNKKVEVYSFFPCDRADCPCQKTNLEWKKKLASMPTDKRQALVLETGFLVCPRDKSKMQRYKITCRNCKEVLGYCWAIDASLKDWCDFHYVQWTDGEEWRGCLTPHISPITEELCLECCCGEDTRDFRANMTLPAKVAYETELQNVKGREFNNAVSTFTVRNVSKDVLPFKKGNIWQK